MSETDTFNQLVEVMLDEDDDSLDEFILTESEKDEVLAALSGDTTLMNYLMLFEEFLEQHDLYLFTGWDDAQIVGQPSVEKFWVTFDLLIDHKTDFRGARRINDAMPQGQVTAKRLQDGNILVRFQILKRLLDQIETDNKEKIEKLSDQALEEL